MNNCIFRNQSNPQPPKAWKNGKYVLLSRIILERKLGRPIKPGFYALHKCNIGNCINEEHLYEGTPSQNQIDRYDNDPNYRDKTHCPKGHEYTQSNIYHHGGRRCKQCRNEYNTKYRLKAKRGIR